MSAVGVLSSAAGVGAENASVVAAAAGPSSSSSSSSSWSQTAGSGGRRTARKQRLAPTDALLFDVGSTLVPASSPALSVSSADASFSAPSSAAVHSTSAASSVPSAVSLSHTSLSSSSAVVSSSSPVSPSHARQMLSLSVLSALPSLSNQHASAPPHSLSLAHSASLSHSLLSHSPSLSPSLSHHGQPLSDHPSSSTASLSVLSQTPHSHASPHSPSYLSDAQHMSGVHSSLSHSVDPPSSTHSSSSASSPAPGRQLLSSSPSSARRGSASVTSNGGSSGVLAPLSVSPVPVLRCRSCNCKNSKCLKLYCECFAAGIYCDECNCKHCHNNVAHEAERKQAIEVTLERNPRAFRPKIAVTATASPKHNNHTTAASSASGGDSQSLGLSVSLSHYKGADSGRSAAASADEQSLLLLDDPSLGYYDSVTAVRQVHHKGCHCKKSFCLKKYCECKDCKNHSGSVERLALESKGQLPPSSASFLPPSAMPSSVAVSLSPVTLGQSPSSSMGSALTGGSTPQLSGAQPPVTTDVVHELTRSLLLAASRHSTADESPTDTSTGRQHPQHHQQQQPRRPDALSVSPNLSADVSSSQAVHDLLLLASPLASAGQLSVNSFFPTAPQPASGSNSLNSSSSAANKRKRGDGPTPSVSSKQQHQHTAAAAGGRDEDAAEERRRQIRRDALASVHKARQLAASHAVNSNNTLTANAQTGSSSSGSSALLCAEDAMDESSSAASHSSSASSDFGSGISALSGTSLSANTSPATSPAPSDDVHSPAPAPTALQPLDEHDAAVLVSNQPQRASLPLLTVHAEGQHAALEEFSLFLKKMRAVQQRSQHYALSATPRGSPPSVVDSARSEQQAEA